MENRVLVTFATRYGSTHEVAETISDTLREGGAVVDVLPAKDITDIAPYSMVVIGSPVFYEKLLPDVVRMVKKHQNNLNKIPVAIFSVGITIREDTEENRQKIQAVMEPLCQLVHPVLTGMFAGKLDYSKLSLPVRTIMKAIKAPEGDFQDPAAIREWAGLLLAETGSKED